MNSLSAVLVAISAAAVSPFRPGHADQPDQRAKTEAQNPARIETGLPPMSGSSDNAASIRWTSATSTIISAIMPARNFHAIHRAAHDGLETPLAGGSAILMAVERSSGANGIISAERASAAGVDMIAAVMMLGSAFGTAAPRIAP